MAPVIQPRDSISDSGRSDLVSTVTQTGTLISHSTKGSTPTPVSSIINVPPTFSTPTATPTYITKGSSTPTNTSLRGSQPPSKMAIQSSTLAFILVLTFLLGISLCILAWKKGWGYRNTAVVQAKQPALRRQGSEVTLVDESSLRRHRGGRGVAVETSELYLQGDGSVRHVEGRVVHVPEKMYGGLVGF